MKTQLRIKIIAHSAFRITHCKNSFCGIFSVPILRRGLKNHIHGIGAVSRIRGCSADCIGVLLRVIYNTDVCKLISGLLTEQLTRLGGSSAEQADGVDAVTPLRAVDLADYDQ